MSKEVLMAFARGKELKQSYIVVYDVSCDVDVNIHSCDTYTDDLSDNGIWIQVCETKQDVERYAPEAVIQKAIEAYLELNKR